MSVSVLSRWTDVFAYHRSWSIFLGALVVLCWSYYNVLCTLTPVFNNAFILVACIIINTLVISPLVFVTRQHFFELKGSWRRSLSALGFGFIDSILIILMSFAFQHIAIGDASCLFAMRVVWTPIVEAVWQRRCLSKGQVVVTLLSVLGAVLITQPEIIFGAPAAAASDELLQGVALLSSSSSSSSASSNSSVYVAASTTSSKSEKSTAYFAATLAGFLAGLSYILLALCPDTHWAVWQSMIVPLGWIVAPLNYIVSNGFWAPSDYGVADVVKLVFIALFDLLGRACRTVAVQEDTASTVALVSVLEIPFTYFWGWIYAGQNLKALNFVGASLVMASVVLLSMPCLWEEKPDEEMEMLVGGGKSGNGSGDESGWGGEDAEENEGDVNQ